MTEARNKLADYLRKARTFVRPRDRRHVCYQVASWIAGEAEEGDLTPQLAYDMGRLLGNVLGDQVTA